jgi:DNA repair exonuclease SbcCD nuclease subunit
VKQETHLFISDIHMNNRLVHAKPGSDGVTDRLQNQLDLLKRVGETADEHECKSIFVLGDLFDKSLVDAITLTETTRALAALAATRRVFILPGNHDAINTRGGRFVVEAFGAMGNENIRYLETGDRLSTDASWLGFWPLQYCSQEEATERIAAMQTRVAALPKRERRNEVLLLHQSIMGCDHVGWRCDDGLEPDFVCREFNFVNSGHFHESQTFGPEDQGMYLGAPLHLRYEDAGRKAGYWVITYSSDGQCTRRFVPGGCPSFHVIDWEDVPHAAAKPPKAWAKIAKGDYVRVNVEATSADWELLRPRVAEAIDLMKSDHGFHASFKYKPLYHHTRRITGVTATDPTMKPEAMADAYLNSPNVDKGELDKATLSRIAREALEAARAKAERWAE